MKQTVRFSMVVGLALVLAACSGQRSRPATSTAAPVAAVDSGASSAGAQGATATTGAGGAQEGSGALGAAGALGSQRVIYFDYDSDEIRPEYVDVIAAHGRFLAGNANVRIRLEGNTDERGSREYNIGLGERRAQTVKRALALQGVREAQLATVSYGEERPAVAGADESAYARNRRVEIVYIN